MAAASEAALWRREAGVGPEAPCRAPLPPPAVPILPILSLGASGTGPGSSAFSSGRCGQTRSGLLLLGGGRCCFWRLMYSTEGRAGSEPRQGPLEGGGVGRAGPRGGPTIGGPWGQGSGSRQGQWAPTHSPRSPPSLSGRCSPAWAARPPPPALGEMLRAALSRTLTDAPPQAHARKPASRGSESPRAGGYRPLTRLALQVSFSSWTQPRTWEGPACNAKPTSRWTGSPP